MKPKHQTHSANLKRTKAKRAPGKGREHKKASHRVAKSLAFGVYLLQHKCFRAICAQKEVGISVRLQSLQPQQEVQEEKPSLSLR